MIFCNYILIYKPRGKGSNNGCRISVQMDGRCKHNHKRNPNGSSRFACKHNPSTELLICIFAEIVLYSMLITNYQ